MRNPVLRVRHGVELLVELKAAHQEDECLSDMGQLRRVQTHARATGGLAALVAEIMSSYTGPGHVGDRPIVLGGRELSGLKDNHQSRGHHVSYPRLGLDMALARLAVPMVAARAKRAQAGVETLDLLARDVKRQRMVGAAGSQSVASGLCRWAPEVAQGALVRPCGSVITTSMASPGELATAAARVVVKHGLTHARIGAAGRWAGTSLSVSHWETARVVSTGVSRLIGSLLRPDGRDHASVDEQAESVGTDPTLLRDLLPAIDAALRPIVSTNLDMESPVGRASTGIPAVPDQLGLVYGIATLVGVGQLLESAPARAVPTAARTASITRSTSASVRPDPLGRQTPRP